MNERTSLTKIYDANSFKLNRIDFAIYCRCLYSYMKSGPYQMEMTMLFGQVTSYLEQSILDKYKQTKDFRKTRQNEIFEKFILLVKQHCARHRSVEFYAEQLCITPQYLSRISREVSGKNASDWINEFVILEIKTLLKYTNLTINEVSLELNFPDQSSLGKYFRKHVGMSPRQFSKTMISKIAGAT